MPAAVHGLHTATPTDGAADDAASEADMVIGRRELGLGVDEVAVAGLDQRP